MQEVKVLVLTNKQILVSQLEEVAPLDIGDPNCKLIEPFILNDDGSLNKISEKPEFDRLINSGLYINNPDILNLIPKATIYHMTQLIEDVNSLGKKIGVFPIDDSSWIDVGQWSEYRKLVNKF